MEEIRGNEAEKQSLIATKTIPKTVWSMQIILMKTEIDDSESFQVWEHWAMA